MFYMEQLDWESARLLVSENWIVVDSVEKGRAIAPTAVQPHLSSWKKLGKRLSIDEMLVPAGRTVLIEDYTVLRLDDALRKFIDERGGRLVIVAKVPWVARAELSYNLRMAA